MQEKFENFLKQLKTKDNKVLIETIEKGFKAITENFGDIIIRVDRLREEAKVPALDQFNEMAAMTAHSMGNEVLNFLRNSGERYNHLYSVDEEPELDFNPTTVSGNPMIDGESDFKQYPEYSRYDEIYPRDEMEDNLGLTAKELTINPTTNIEDDDWDIFNV